MVNDFQAVCRVSCWPCATISCPETTRPVRNVLIACKFMRNRFAKSRPVSRPTNWTFEKRKPCGRHVAASPAAAPNVVVVVAADVFGSCSRRESAPRHRPGRTVERLAKTSATQKTAVHSPKSRSLGNISVAGRGSGERERGREGRVAATLYRDAST